MSKKLTKEENKLYRKYHYPKGSNLNSVKVGAIFLSLANTSEHEHKKFEICLDLLKQGHKYITEAERKATEEEILLFKLRLKKIVDVVDLTTEDEFEIIHKNEKDEQILFYRKKGTIAVLVGETIICKVCGLKYPKRNNKGICQICLKRGK